MFRQVVLFAQWGESMNELEIISHRQIEGMSIFFDAIDYRTPHVHSEWELIWIIDHPLSVTCGHTQFVAEPGEMVLFNPNDHHEFHKVGQTSTFLCFQISPRLMPAMSKLAVDSRVVSEYLSENEMNQLKKTMAEMLRVYLRQEEGYALYCVGHSFLILHKLLTRLPTHEQSREETASIDKRNERLRRLIRFVDENYMHKIRLSDFAAQEGCSMSHLSHFVKDAMNQTFQEYVGTVRFNCACRLIAAGNTKMLDVCMESGFSDYRYFSRMFQKQFGMTPEQYSKLSQTQQRSSAERRSRHSVERFYTKEDSLLLLDKILP